MASSAPNIEPDQQRTEMKSDGTEMIIYFPWELTRKDYLGRLLESVSCLLRPIYGEVSKITGEMPNNYKTGVRKEKDMDLYHLLKHMLEHEDKYFPKFKLSLEQFQDYRKVLQDARNRLAHEDLQPLTDVYMVKCFSMALAFANATETTWSAKNIYSLQKMFERHMSSKTVREAKLKQMPDRGRLPVVNGHSRNRRSKSRKRSGSRKRQPVQPPGVSARPNTPRQRRIRQGNKLDYIGKEITDESCKELSNDLKKRTSATTLNLSKNQIGDVGLEYLSNALPEMKALTTLNLSKNQIGSEGLKHLSTSLEKIAATLKTFNLGNNTVGDVGLEYLSKALPKMNALEGFCLNGTQITDAGLKHLSNALPEMKVLEKLYLDSNQIGNVGLEHLSKALRKTKALKLLELVGNQIGDAGLEHLCTALPEMKALTTLHLSNNKIGEEAKSKFKQEWEKAGKDASKLEM